MRIYIRHIILTLAVLTAGYSSAQIHEIGVTVGGTNYVGDVGKTNFIDPQDVGYGIIYRWNRSPRHAWRVNYNFLKISGDDTKADSALRQARGLNFDNAIHELSVGLEFNFLEFDLHNDWFTFTPYLYTGITGFQYEEKYINGFGNSVKTEDKTNLAIPLSFGAKALINKQFVISAEVGFRYTFTDNLDGSNPISNNYSAYRFGNQNTNDWYFFSGLSITYTFGSNPCYCEPQ